MTLANVIDAFVILALAYAMTMMIILLARPVVARIAGTNWAYSLWGILLIPPLAVFAPPTLTEGVGLFSYPTTTLSGTTTAPGALLGMWLLGVVVTGSMSIRRSRKIRRLLEDSFGPLSAAQMRQVQESCSRANVFPPPNTVTSTVCASPAVMSGLNPILVLPEDFFQRYSPSESRLVLQHELVHLQRFDLVWNILFRGLRCLLWFIPFIRRCEILFRSDQERACDHSVVCDQSGRSRAEYARALFKTVVPKSASIGISGFRNGRHELLLRTEMLGLHRRTRTQSAAGFAVLAVCVLLVISVSANSNTLTGTVSASSVWCKIYGGLGM